MAARQRGGGAGAVGLRRGGVALRTALIALALAGGVALLAINPKIYGIDLWKIVLGFVGLWLMREAGREKKS